LKANSRKFQPSEPNRTPHIGISRFGAPTDIAAAEPNIAVSSMTGTATAMSHEPSGHGWALT